MDVIIVSKTKMSNASCVGGVLANGRFVRLLNSAGYNQDLNTEIEIGDVYTIKFAERLHKKPPHIEDILVHSIKYKFKFSSIQKMLDYLIIKLNIKIWKGDTDILFNNKLTWTNGGSGFITEKTGIPPNSVGFWISNKDLTRKDFNDKVRYSYPKMWRNIPYVGFDDPVDKIPAGTLLRVSLARWWSPNGEEERCYLQLSGWYNLKESESLKSNNNINCLDEEEDDLPF